MNKKITVEISEELYKDLRRAMFVRGLAGEINSFPDMFLAKLVEKIDEGESYWEVKQRKKG